MLIRTKHRRRKARHEKFTCGNFTIIVLTHFGNPISRQNFRQRFGTAFITLAHGMHCVSYKVFHALNDPEEGSLDRLRYNTQLK